MEPSSSAESSKEGWGSKLSSIAMVEENCLDNGKIPVIQSTSIDSSCKEADNRIKSIKSVFSEEESNLESDRVTVVQESRNDSSNSPTYSYPYFVHTCSKGIGNVPPNGHVANLGDEPESSSTTNELQSYSEPNGNGPPPNGQVVKLGDKAESSSITNKLESYSKCTCPKDKNGDLTETSDPNCDGGLNGQAVKLGGEAVSADISVSITNELDCGETLNLENFHKTTPVETELILDSSLKNNQPSLNLFSDFDTSSSNESNIVPSLILKRWEDSPSSENLWYNLKPCSVVLQRCDINENSVYAKSLSCNSSAEKFDTISVISDSEDEPVKYSGARLSLGKLRPRKSQSESSQNSEKERYSFTSKCLLATTKGSSKMRKNNSKILTNMCDLSKNSDSDHDGPNNDKLKDMHQKTIQVSAQVHKPPESDDDSDVIMFNPTSKTLSENSKNKKDITVEIQSNASTSSDQENNGKRKRNSSSISSMSSSELLSDSEYVGSKRRIIRPSTCLQPFLQIHKEINQETMDSTSDLGVSDHRNTCFESSEISEKLLTANMNVEVYPTQTNLSEWTYLPNIDISRLKFKPCHVVLNRCDDQIELDSSKVTDVKSGNQPISRRSSDSNFSFSALRNPNRTGSDNFHSELSDTDEVISPTKKISPKLKKKQGLTKKKLLGLHRSAKLPARQKIMNKSAFMKEILELKNTMKRAEKKIDHLIELHQQLLDSE